MPEIDAEFTALPLRTMAEAALQRARELGAEHADFRAERLVSQVLRLSDGNLEGTADTDDIGFAVRVVRDGTWGFAAGVELTAEAAVAVAEQAVEVARLSAAVNRERIELAAAPVHADVTWVSAYEVDPFTVSTAEKVATLREWSARLAPHVDHVDAALQQVKEHKFYADAAGTVTTQQRVRLHPIVQVMTTAGDRFDTMRTVSPPVGRGYEYLPTVAAELDELPELLAEKLRAPSVDPGTYDLVIDPSNLWLTIHESIGHATELDRALGYEAAYAGTSFATFDKLGTLHYGSPALNITGDRTVRHGLSTVGFDDEGVATGEFDLIREGTLVGYQLDRRMARLMGFDASNGCAFADSPAHMPIQRMANVSLRPAPGGPDTAELIGGVTDGLYLVGDKSWSIDMQRYNFQFTAQRAMRIKNGRIAGQVRDFAYQATTTDFWSAMEAVGGEQTYVLGGAFNCGKGQPSQIAPVSHGCPSALLRGIRILNTAREAGQ